jgi:hypothetical protein
VVGLARRRQRAVQILASQGRVLTFHIYKLD